jgi:hypothetical protein
MNIRPGLIERTLRDNLLEEFHCAWQYPESGTKPPLRRNPRSFPSRRKQPINLSGAVRLVRSRSLATAKAGSAPGPDIE